MKLIIKDDIAVLLLIEAIITLVISQQVGSISTQPPKKVKSKILAR